MTQNLTGKLNQLGLLLINLMLLVAFYFQFAQHELPCPLCLLQRVALCAIAVALAANVLLGDKPGHYGMMLLAAAAAASPWPAAKCCCTSPPATPASARPSWACTSTPGPPSPSSPSSSAAGCC
ncbi:disulfide bond formation protein B [Chromobacterium haemolyticum]|nr:disulfide bond formation protein B [Chromobacterium haemolyticum]